MDLEDRIRKILKDAYHIAATCVSAQDGGWSAHAFLVEDGSGKYFLKAYDKARPSAAPWIQAIDRYAPIVQWLHERTELRGHTAGAVLTAQNEYRCQDEAYAYLLSEYIEGYVPGDAGLNGEQRRELARILGLLHQSTSSVPSSLIGLQAWETFGTDFCGQLQNFLQTSLKEKDDAVRHEVEPFAGCLGELIARFRQLSCILKGKSHSFVLCHSDAHAWNVMQGRSLVLIDWECLKLAPPEQDLILYVTESQASEFFVEYRNYTDYCKPDLDAYEFYYLKRRLEDIWEWVKQLRAEGLVKPLDCTLGYLRQTLADCKDLSRFRAGLQAFFC